MKLARLPALPCSQVASCKAQATRSGKSRRWHSEAAKIDDRHRQIFALGSTSVISDVLSDSRIRLRAEHDRSPNLRVEVTANPCSFQIIEKSSGQVLLSRKGTYVGEDHFQAKETKGLKREANQLQGTFTFSPTTDSARITFSFPSPENVRISLTSADANAKVTPQIVCRLESPLGWEFELLGQSLESGLIADDLVGGEHEERAQEGIAFGERNVEPFECS